MWKKKKLRYRPNIEQNQHIKQFLERLLMYH